MPICCGFAEWRLTSVLDNEFISSCSSKMLDGTQVDKNTVKKLKCKLSGLGPIICFELEVSLKLSVNRQFDEDADVPLRLLAISKMNLKIRSTDFIADVTVGTTCIRSRGRMPVSLCMMA